MRYTINAGVEQAQNKVRKYFVAGTISLLLASFAAVPVFAAGSSGSKASPCGATHGAFADVNDNFGWLGPLGGTPGYHGAVGQQTGATGSNNSSVDCNPQN
jgi:hypothetical protein